MRTLALALLAVFCLAGADLSAADVNVLIIGSTRSFAVNAGVRAVDGNGLKNKARDALTRDMRVRGKLNVVREELFRDANMNMAMGGGGKIFPMEFRCHSLAQWYFWPEKRQARLDNVRGKGETKWDIVVIVGDPYVIATMPGVFAEGVKLVADLAREGKAKVLLLMPWANNKGSADVAEVVCRVGLSAKIPVAPRSWASSIERKLSGKYEVANPFLMKYVDKRNITYHHTGSSSENGIERALKAVTKICMVNARKERPKSGGPKIDFNYGRANSNFEKHKQYKVSPNLYDRSYGFPMQDHSKTAADTMLYGIDKRLYSGRGSDDGTDLGIAYDMIRLKEVEKDVRCIPIRLMWAKMKDANPNLKPLGDRWHMAGHLNHASAAFIYTLLSGRCPINGEPAKDAKGGDAALLGRKIGYETAWRMSHLTNRVPGFTVRPRDMNEALFTGDKSSLTVRLYYKPTSDVTVTIKSDKALAVKQKTLTFTPQNHAKPQTVMIAGREVEEDTRAKVKFTTSSKDKVFDKLHDAWAYTVKKPKEDPKKK